MPKVRAPPLSVKHPRSAQPAGISGTDGGEELEDSYKVRRFGPPQNSVEFPKQVMSHPLLALEPGPRIALSQ